MAKDSRRNRVGVAQVTDEQIAAMVASGVSAEVTTDTVVAERSGSDDKVAAVVAEGAGPRVATYTPEGRAWMEADTFGLKTEGIYGKKGQTALQPVDLQRHAQVVGSLDPAKLETIHGRDETAPDSVICPICTKAVTSFVRTALIDRTTGDLVRDNGVVRYRGQFVAVGPDPMNLPVIGFHPGECLFRGRLKRDRSGNVIYKTITLQNGRTREIPDLLPCHNFAQANERSAAVRIGLQAKRDERVAEEGRMRQALGFKVGDTARTSGGNRTDDGINRGSYAPKTPRGQHRGQRRWVDNEDAS